MYNIFNALKYSIDWSIIQAQTAETVDQPVVSILVLKFT